MAKCNLCPRKCNADRTDDAFGYCRTGYIPEASKAYLHMWEEPCISGTRGSGTVFFNGCNLRCIYCQNNAISRGSGGKKLSCEELCQVFMNLKNKGAHNINLVTPTHFAHAVAESIAMAKQKGLDIPIVYNTGGYELVDTLRTLENHVDVYLPDFKYMDKEKARNYSLAEDYPDIAKAAIEEMVRQKPNVNFNDEGIAVSGVIVRHLLLPGSLGNSKAVIEYLYKTYGDSIYISIMNQYTPSGKFPQYPELSFTPSRREYEKLIDFALSLGVRNAYIQGEQASDKMYIPDFDFEGI